MKNQVGSKENCRKEGRNRIKIEIESTKQAKIS